MLICSCYPERLMGTLRSLNLTSVVKYPEEKGVYIHLRITCMRHWKEELCLKCFSAIFLNLPIGWWVYCLRSALGIGQGTTPFMITLVHRTWWQTGLIKHRFKCCAFGTLTKSFIALQTIFFQSVLETNPPQGDDSDVDCDHTSLCKEFKAV